MCCDESGPLEASPCLWLKLMKSPRILESVKVLWRANSVTLGFLPDGAFVDYASRRHILVALDSSSECVGYLLYRIAKDRATIAHLCVANVARGQGHASALVNHLVAQTSNLRGVDLRCRRDFPAYKLWPRLGFAALREASGRAADGSELTHFWLDHNHPDLFTQETTAALDTVIDTNVFVDLAEFGVRNHKVSCRLVAGFNPALRHTRTLQRI